MGGLGNGRRGGRAPPLLIGALVACILVLGFNYWVSSSRNLEMQTKLYDLESQVKRGAVERGAAEIKKNKFQDVIQKQKEQIEQMENFYKRQVEGAQNICIQEKGTLQKNISSSTKTIQRLKGEVNQLNDDLGKLQKELQSCQNNIQTLDNKLTYDMTHCNAEVMSQKEQCDERVAAAKLEVETKMKKLSASPEESSLLKKTLDKVDKVNEVVSEEVKAPKDLNQTIKSRIKKNKALELLTNDIIVDEEKTSSKEEPHSDPPAAADKLDVLPPPPDGAVIADERGGKNAEISKNNPAKDEKIEVMDSHKAAQTEEREPDIEGILTGKKEKESPDAQKADEALEYMVEEQAVESLNVGKQQKLPDNIDLEQELADYNGDDENEGEFEADKQAELAQMSQGTQEEAGTDM